MAQKVFIVEDEVIIRMVLERTLKRFGYVIVGSATSGQDAIAKIIHAKPDAIIMDIQLKGTMSGIETAMKIRETLQTPILYLTANSKTLQDAQSTWPFSFIDKPFNDLELKDKLHDLVLDGEY